MAKPAFGTALDTGSAFYPSLAAAWGLLEGSGTTSADSFGSRTLILDPAVSWGTDSAGDVCAVLGSEVASPLALASALALSTSSPGDTSWTLAWRFKQDTSGTHGSIAGNGATSVQCWGGSGVFIQGDAGGQVRFVYGSFINEHDYVLSYNQLTGQVNFFVDGVGDTNNPRTFAAGLTLATLGAGPGWGGSGLIGTLSYLYGWSGRALGGAEAATLHSNPYALFSAGGATTAAGSATGVATALGVTAAGTYISAADGNWSVPSTWLPAGVPGAGDKVTLNHHVTITSDVTIGDGGATIVLDCAHGTLTISGATLTIRGNAIFGYHRAALDTNYQTLALTPVGTTGAALILDGNAGVAPTVSFGDNAQLTVNGTAAARCTVRTKVGTAGLPGCFQSDLAMGQYASWYADVSYCDFVDLGEDFTSSGGPQYFGILASTLSGAPAGARFAFDHCTFNEVFAWPSLRVSNGGPIVISFTNCTFTGTWDAANRFMTFDVENFPIEPGGVRLFDRCTFFTIMGRAALRDFTITNCYFDDGIWNNGAPRAWAEFTGNFLRRRTAGQGPSDRRQSTMGDYHDNYLLAQDAGLAQPYFFNGAYTNLVIQNNIYQYRGHELNSFGSTLIGYNEGYNIDNTFSRVMYVVDNLFLPPQADDVGQGSVPAVWLNSRDTPAPPPNWVLPINNAVIEHNTICLNGTLAILAGDTTLGQKGHTVLSLRSNIVRNAAVPPSNWNVFLLNVSPPGPLLQTDVIVNDGVNSLADYNAWLGLVAAAPGTWNDAADGTVYSTPLTVTPGAHDLSHTDPVFLDPTRNVQTWAQTFHGTDGSLAAALAVVQADPTLVNTGANSLLEWVRAGFVPTNAALFRAAHDGSTIGAFPYATSSGATAYTLIAPTYSTHDVGVASGAFTVQPNGNYTGTITPHSTGAGTFTPTSLAWSGTAQAQTFTYTPSTTSGSPHTITTTASPALGTNPAGSAYAVTAPLQAGALLVTSVSSTSVLLTVGAATGGTPPYVLTFSRDEDPTGTAWSTNRNYGFPIQSGSGLTCTDSGLTPGATYHYRVDLTDANLIRPNVWSNAVTVTLPLSSGGYTLAPPAPARGDLATASAAFTITPGSAYTGAITPADGGAGGTFASADPSWDGAALHWAASSAAKTFTYTPAIWGVRTISTVSSPTLGDPGPVSYHALVQLGPTGTAPAGNRARAFGGFDPFANGAWFQEFKRNVAADSLDPNSAAMVARFPGGGTIYMGDLSTTTANGGNSLYGIPFNVVPGNQPTRIVTVDEPYYWAESDVDQTTHQALVPIPDNVCVEGWYDAGGAFPSAIGQTGGDQHILVAVRNESTGGLDTLWEMESSYTTDGGGTWHCSGLAKFDLTSGLPRFEGHTSGDAAGLMILPLLLRYEEVASGVIPHCLRGNFANVLIMRGYTWPGRHAAVAGSGARGDTTYLAYGARLRLNDAWYQTHKASFTGQARPILNALHDYGLMNADGTSFQCTIEGVNDERWVRSELNQIAGIPLSAFEVITQHANYTVSGPTFGPAGAPAVFTLAKYPVTDSNYFGNIYNYTNSQPNQAGWSSSAVSLSDATPTGTATFTPPSPGTYTLIFNQGNQDWIDAPPVTFTATGPQPAATAYTLAGPATGTPGVASANFTVTPNGTYTGTITPSDGGAGGVFSPTALSWSNSAAARTFTYTPAAAGLQTIRAASSPALVDPNGIAFTAVTPGTPTGPGHLAVDGHPRTGVIRWPGDRNVFRFRVVAEDDYRIATFGIKGQSDPMPLQLWLGVDSDPPVPLGFADRGGPQGNPELNVHLVPGNYTVTIVHRLPAGMARYVIGVARTADPRFEYGADRR